MSSENSEVDERLSRLYELSASGAPTFTKEALQQQYDYFKRSKTDKNATLQVKGLFSLKKTVLKYRDMSGTTRTEKSRPRADGSVEEFQVRILGPCPLYRGIDRLMEEAETSHPDHWDQPLGRQYAYRRIPSDGHACRACDMTEKTLGVSIEKIRAILKSDVRWREFAAAYLEQLPRDVKINKVVAFGCGSTACPETLGRLGFDDFTHGQETTTRRGIWQSVKTFFGSSSSVLFSVIGRPMRLGTVPPVETRSSEQGRKTWSAEEDAMVDQALLRSTWQHAFVLEIAELLSCRPHGTERVRCLAQDPDYTDKDKRALQSAGVEVVDDPKGLLQVDDATVVFAICPSFPLWQILADFKERPASIITNRQQRALGKFHSYDHALPWPSSQVPVLSALLRDFTVYPMTNKVSPKARRMVHQQYTDLALPSGRHVTNVLLEQWDVAFYNRRTNVVRGSDQTERADREGSQAHLASGNRRGTRSASLSEGNSSAQGWVALHRNSFAWSR